MFFFFKQKTAYEMRISDWSSDVCSSDLRRHLIGQRHRLDRPDPQQMLEGEMERHVPAGDGGRTRAAVGLYDVAVDLDLPLAEAREVRHRAQRTRSEERRVGKEGGSTCWSRGSPQHSKKKKTTRS